MQRVLVIKIYYTMELDQSVPSSFNILMLTSSTGKSGLEINVFSVKDETSSVVVVYVQQ